MAHPLMLCLFVFINLAVAQNHDCDNKYTLDLRGSDLIVEAEEPIVEAKITNFDPILRQCVWRLYGTCASTSTIPCYGNSICKIDSRVVGVRGKTLSGDELQFDGVCTCPPGQDPSGSSLDTSYCIRKKQFGETCNDDDDLQRCSSSKNLECVQSQEHGEPRCECYEGFKLQDSDRSCRPAQYGEKCNETLRCDPNYNRLICSDGFCRCPQERVLEEVSGSCKLKVGSTCDYHDCVKNAKCEGSSPNSQRICKCLLSGYSATKDGFCLAAYGTECSKSSECFGTNVGCTNGVCTCNDPLFQTYVEAKKTCLNVAGGRCSTTSNTTETCVDGAVCRDGRCSCSSGLIESMDKKCRKGHGSPCRQLLSKNGVGHDCDFNLGLACIDEKCQCISKELEYSEWSGGRGCKAPKGSPCGTGFPAGKCLKEENGQTPKNCPTFNIKCSYPFKCVEIGKEHFQCLDSK